jgi:hypothetical protein
MNRQLKARIKAKIYAITNLMMSSRFNRIRNKQTNKVHLLFFYSRSMPFDKGYDLSLTAESIIQELGPFFKSITGHNKQTLKMLEGGEKYCNEYSESLLGNQNANYFGYFDFKPFIINDQLKKLSENEILIYHDGNFVKNPQYWESDWENIGSILEYLLNKNKTSFWVQYERGGTKVKEFVKEYALDYFFTPAEKKIVKNCHLLNAARIVVRNDKAGRAFIEDYLRYCSLNELISASPNSSPHADFKWSCGDQDVLNCLIYRYILDFKIPAKFPLFSFYYRVLRLENRNFEWLIDGKALNHRTGIYLLKNVWLDLYISFENLKKFTWIVFTVFLIILMPIDDFN